MWFYSRKVLDKKVKSLKAYLKLLGNVKTSTERLEVPSIAMREIGYNDE